MFIENEIIRIIFPEVLDTSKLDKILGNVTTHLIVQNMFPLIVDHRLLSVAEAKQYCVNSLLVIALMALS